MALDRKIRISYPTPGSRDEHGDFIPGPIESIDVWATVFPLSQQDTFEQGGVLTARNRRWRIRFWPALVGVGASALTVYEGEDVTLGDGTMESIVYVLNNIYEDTGRDGEVRRRWHVLEGTWTR